MSTAVSYFTRCSFTDVLSRTPTGVSEINNLVKQSKGKVDVFNLATRESPSLVSPAVTYVVDRAESTN